MKFSMNYLKTRPLATLVLGFLLGILVILGVRFFMPTQKTHYHANFAIYINGQLEAFEGPGFYEEVVACADHDTDPAQRVHMHNQINDLVHVHADLVTWGHFLNNIGYSVSPYHLQALDKTYLASETQPLIFILNGQRVNDISARLIKSEDRLLISYGKTTDKELNARYDSIAQSAHQANQETDPGSCGAASLPSWRQRIQQVF